MTNELKGNGHTHATCSVCKKRVSIVNDIEDFNDKIDKGLCVSFDPNKLFTQERKANLPAEMKYSRQSQGFQRMGYVAYR